MKFAYHYLHLNITSIIYIVLSVLKVTIRRVWGPENIEKRRNGSRVTLPL